MKFSEIWQYNLSKILVLFTIFFIPLLVIKLHPLPYVSGKSFIMVMGSSLSLFFILLGRLRMSNNKIGLSFLKIFLTLFSIVLILSSIFGVAPNHAFFGEFNGFSASLIISGIMLAFSIYYLLKEDAGFIKSILWTVAVSSFFYVLTVYFGDSLYQNSADAGSIGNTSYAGGYLLVSFFSTLAMAFILNKKWEKIFAWFFVLFIATSPILFNINIFKGLVSIKDILNNPVLLSGSANGAVFGIATGVFASISIFLIRSKNKFIQWGGLFLLIGLFSGLWYTGQALVNPESKINQVYIEDKNSNRFIFWDIAYIGLSEKPLLGWGVNAYVYVFQEKFDPIFFSPGYAVELWTNNPHNMIAEYAVSTGYVGLFVYILVLGGAGTSLFLVSRSEDRTRKIVSIFMFGALLGYTVQNFFVFDTVVPLMMFYVLIGWALFVSKEKYFNIKDIYSKIFIYIIMFFALFLFIFSGVRSWNSSLAWGDYLMKQKINNLNLDNYSAGYIGDYTFFSLALSNIIRSDFLNGESRDTVEEAKSKIITLAENIQKAVNNSEKKIFRAYWVMGDLYSSTLLFDNLINKEMLISARKEYFNALSINPNNPMLYLDIAQSYAYEKDYKNAEKYIKAAIALAPEYKQSYIVYADSIIDRNLSSKDFERYVTKMRAKWCYEDSPCMTDKWK